MTKRNRNFLLGSLLFLLSSSYGALNLLVRKLQEGQMYRAHSVPRDIRHKWTETTPYHETPGGSWEGAGREPLPILL